MVSDCGSLAPATVYPSDRYRPRAKFFRSTLRLIHWMPGTRGRHGDAPQQGPAHAPPAPRGGDADRQFGNVRVEETVGGIVGGEEANPGRADRFLARLGDHAEIGLAWPAADVVRGARVRQHPAPTPRLPFGRPVHGLHQHVRQEFAVPGSRTPDAP